MHPWNQAGATPPVTGTDKKYVSQFKLQIMAKSKSFFGLRKGSTKSHTYSILDGQQVTKDRVYDVKNPRTEGQMKQRMVMTTVGAAYKFMKAIADHSFEGKSSGMQCMREFNSRNLNRFKAMSSDKGSVAFNSYKDGAINPLPFILAAGSIPALDYKMNSESKLELAFEKDNATLSTAEGIYEAMGISRNDLITFCTVIGEGAVVSGVFEYTPTRFDVVRLVADKTGAVSKPADAFTISTNNQDAVIAITATGNKLTIASGEADFGAVIQSRKSDQSWLRSDAIMVVADDVVEGVKTANQLATYPIGTELILNNGPMANETNASESTSKPSVAPTTVEIASGRTQQLTITNPSNEAVTCTVTAGQSYCSVTNAGLITNTNNGSSDQNATIQVTIGSATFNVAVTLYGTGGGTVE